MSDELHVETREALGTRNSRRLRKAGKTPAVLYGHGEETVHLSIPADELDSAIRHGSKVVKLAGEVSEDALIRDVQWDPFGIDVLHVDLNRVSAGDLVEVEIAIELRGEAPGAREGGIVEQLLHTLKMEVPVSAIPEKLEVNINHLELGDTVLVSDIDLPEAAEVHAEPEEVVVQCIEAVVPEEEEADELVPAGTEEPEVIGRPDEEGGDEEGKN